MVSPRKALERGAALSLVCPLCGTTRPSALAARSLVDARHASANWRCTCEDVPCGSYTQSAAPDAGILACTRAWLTSASPRQADSRPLSADISMRALSTLAVWSKTVFVSLA